jgi:integrase
MPRKQQEPRPVVRNNTDVKKAKSGLDEDGKPKAVWHKVTEASGLYLVCDPPSKRHPSGLKRWMHRYKRPNTDSNWNELSIGHVAKGVDLDKARAAWMDHQFHLRRGEDPQEVRQISRGQTVTFAQCAEMFIKAHAPGKSEGWLRHTKRMFFIHGAKLANEAVATISPNKIEEVIAPLMAERPNQARLALAKWEELFDFAKAKGFRTWDNPAKWLGLHEHLFSDYRRIERKQHPALKYWEMPAFMPELRQHQPNSTGAVALEMMILTVCRPNKEVLLMEWDEVDEKQKIWTVPAWRMKNRKPHSVPLVDRMMELIQYQRRRSNSLRYVLTGYSEAALAERSMIWFLRNTMGIPKEKADVHGFRNTFRSFCLVKKFDYVASEMCLSHTIGTQVERAYWGTDLLDERRMIMDAWAAHIG